MLERQREGIARAKAEGKYKGRKPTVAKQAVQIRALRANGVGASEIARRLNGLSDAGWRGCMTPMEAEPVR